MFTFLLVLILISVLILVHEWGHFYAARRLGVKVEEFGFGFPPRLFSVVRDGIRYSFNLLPLGGFVKIFGEHGEGEGDRESFVSRSAWHRFVILAAGVFMNLVLAWVFFTIGAVAGVPHLADGADAAVPVSVIAVVPRSPAEEAGVKFGDVFLELRSQDISLRVEKEEDVIDFIHAYRGEDVTLLIKRGDEVKEVHAIPRLVVPEGEGPLGVGLGRLTIAKIPWYLAPVEGVRILFRSVWGTLDGLWFILSELVSQGKTSVAVTGPVGIFAVAGETQALGLAYFLQFIGLLSVNLAVLNFLPIPALDGGRVVFLAIEKLRGRKISPQVENFIHTLGFVFLLFLMILVTYRDIVRIL